MTEIIDNLTILNTDSLRKEDNQTILNTDSLRKEDNQTILNTDSLRKEDNQTILNTDSLRKEDTLTIEIPTKPLKDLIYTDTNINQAINTKEESEILNALFSTADEYEEKKTIRDVKISKIIDLV